jgi:flagellar basal-body rod protein FlgC
MMDYSQAFEISASGMTVEKLRIDLTAVNIANMHSAAGADGTLFRPLRLVSRPSMPVFATQFEDGSGDAVYKLRGAQIHSVQEVEVPPRSVYEPGNPGADERGFVALPGVDHVSEMVTLMVALRAYEANVAAMNAAKTMAVKALEIGGNQ